MFQITFHIPFKTIVLLKYAVLNNNDNGKASNCAYFLTLLKDIISKI